MTYRSDELHRRHALRPLLAELERLERARRIELEPFDREELVEALADILGAEPKPPLVERLFARSEGNPLYTEELLAAGLDGRGAAPQSLRDAFMVRIERLSAPAQQVARAVAVGRALDEAALTAVTGLERDALQGALREAVAEQVLVPAADGRFGFRHALLREALYDDLLPGERGELHLDLARYLEQTCETGDERELERVAAVASHYASAGDQPAALRSAVRASRAAGRIHAYGEAADQAERALELWPRVSEDERPTEIDHVDLLGRAARAHSIAGDRNRAEVLLQSALRELDPERDPARYAALLARLSRTIWSLNRGEEAVAAGERALAMIPPDDPFQARPLLQAWLARTKFLRGRFRQAAADGETALQTAVQAGDVFAEAEVSNTLGMAYVALGRVDDGVASLRHAIDIGREHDEPDTLSTAYSNLADMLMVAGRTQEGFATAREGMAQTPRRLIRSHDWITMTVSELAFSAGDWPLAREHLTPPIERLAGTVLIFRLTREAELSAGDRRRGGGRPRPGRGRATGRGVGRAAVDRHVRRPAGRPAGPPARPRRRAGGGGRGARSPGAVHRRRDADRPGQRARGPRRIGARPASPRSARDRPGARRAGSRPAARAAPRGRRPGGRSGGARLPGRGQGRAGRGSRARRVQGVGACGGRLGRRCSAPTARRLPAGGRRNATWPPATAPPPPR